MQLIVDYYQNHGKYSTNHFYKLWYDWPRFLCERTTSLRSFQMIDAPSIVSPQVFLRFWFEERHLYRVLKQCSLSAWWEKHTHTHTHTHTHILELALPSTWWKKYLLQVKFRQNRTHLCSLNHIPNSLFMKIIIDDDVELSFSPVCSSIHEVKGVTKEWTEWIATTFTDKPTLPPCWFQQEQNYQNTTLISWTSHCEVDHPPSTQTICNVGPINHVHYRSLY